MLRVHFTAADLTRTTVAPNADPLWESVLSRFRMRDRQVTYRPWVHALGATTAAGSAPLRAGSAVLDVLAPRGPYFPDFLTPAAGRQGLAAGLEALCRTPVRELRAQLERLAGRGELPGWAVPLAHGDPAALSRLAATLRAYHEVAIAPFTDLVERSVAADHAHRVHLLVTGGLDGLLDSMRPYMRWQPPVLEIDYSVDRDLHLAGRGVRFVPSYFCDRTPVSLADPELPPVIVYPIAQQFRWSNAVRRHKSLDNLVGSTRGAVLRSIEAGATTTQLARRLATSLASVSRHTAVLRDAGLVSSHRHGTAVLHSLTPLGMSILDSAAHG